MEVTFHHYRHILFVRNKPLGGEITQVGGPRTQGSLGTCQKLLTAEHQLHFPFCEAVSFLQEEDFEQECLSALNQHLHLWSPARCIMLLHPKPTEAASPCGGSPAGGGGGGGGGWRMAGRGLKVL